MRLVFLLILLISVSSCLVPKNSLIQEQDHVLQLQNDSSQLYKNVISFQDSLELLEKKIALTELGTKNLVAQIDSLNRSIQGLNTNLDSVVPRLKKTNIERDVWRLNSIYYQKEIERLKFISDSLLEYTSNKK
jgi:septal ring factor EnvC (AmiA/AmiB activator)